MLTGKDVAIVLSPWIYKYSVPGNKPFILPFLPSSCTRHMQIHSQNSAFNLSALYPLKEEVEILKSSPSARDAMNFPKNRPVLCLPKSITFMNPSIKFQGSDANGAQHPSRWSWVEESNNGLHSGSSKMLLVILTDFFKFQLVSQCLVVMKTYTHITAYEWRTLYLEICSICIRVS